MPKEKLIELKPGRGLDSGIAPSAEAIAGTVWKTATNAWFRDLHIEAVPGRTKFISTISRGSKCLAQAAVNGIPRLYYEDLGVVYYYETVSTIIGNLDPGGNYSFEPYGTWLIVSDNISVPKVWKNIGTFITLGDVASQFTRAKIIKKQAQHVLAYSTDVYPSGFHWCTASNPEVWTPSATNSAGALPIRDLDSEIEAVADLGAAHAIYSKDHMLVVQYTGPGNWFGTPNQALKGIGSVSQDGIVSLGKQNWGISRGGIFVTDGLSFFYPDRPTIDRWLQENVDWSRAKEIVGYFNDQLQLVNWVVPLLSGGLTTIAVDPRTKSLVASQTGERKDSGGRSFTFLNENPTFGIDRVVFNYPVIALADGIYFNSVTSTLAGGFALSSQLFDVGKADMYKQWDYVMLEGTITGGEARFGYTDEQTLESLQWTDWKPTTHKMPLVGRESVYFGMEFRSDAAVRLSGITVYGEMAGLVT